MKNNKINRTIDMRNIKKILGIGLLVAAFGAFISPSAAETYNRPGNVSSVTEWQDPTKWNPNGLPNAAGDVAELSNPNGARTINVDSGTYTLGILNNLATGASGWTLTGTAVAYGVLDFNNNGAAAEINFNGGSLVLTNIDLRLNGDLIISNAGNRRIDIANTNKTSGTGDLVFKNNFTTTVGGNPLGINANLSLNHTGWVSNEGAGATGAGAGVNIGGTVGATVTGFKQNSADSMLTVTNNADITNFTGQVLVESGTLFVNQLNFANASGINVSAAGLLKTGNGNFEVNAGTELGGNGTVLVNTGANTLTVNTNATLLSGLDIQGRLTLAASSTYSFGGDTTTVSGSLTLTSGWDLFFTDGADYELGADSDYVTLFNYGTLVAASDLTNVNISGLNFDTSSLVFNTLDNSVVLYGITVIPEPSTWLLLGVGVGLLAWLRRKKN
jgi:hypothetical protein